MGSSSRRADVTPGHREHQLHPAGHGRAKKKCKTIVFTTHDPNIAAAADTVVLLRAGRFLAFGPTALTLNVENLSATYGVRVDVVILAGRPVIRTSV
jgi:ABC-type cobalamin/Fe3+-siderophores transport system ATPase subunit